MPLLDFKLINDININLAPNELVIEGVELSHYHYAPTAFLESLVSAFKNNHTIETLVLKNISQPFANFIGFIQQGITAPGSLSCITKLSLQGQDISITPLLPHLYALCTKVNTLELDELTPAAINLLLPLLCSTDYLITKLELTQLTPDAIKSVIAALHHIDCRIIYLGLCKLPPEAIQPLLPTLLEPRYMIRKLDLRQLPTESVETLAPVLQSSLLYMLELSKLTAVSAEKILAVLEQPNCNIPNLRLSELNPEVIKTLSPLFKKSPALDLHKLSADSIKNILPQLKESACNIRWLGFSKLNIEIETVEMLLPVLESSSCPIRAISLCQLKEEVIKRLFQHWNPKTQIHMLCLSQLTPEALKCLPDLQWVTHLYLSQLTMSSITTLSTLRLNNLSCLGIERLTPPAIDRLRPLWKIISNNNALLHINDISIGAAASIKRIAAKFNLRVCDDYSTSRLSRRSIINFPFLINQNNANKKRKSENNLVSQVAKRQKLEQPNLPIIAQAVQSFFKPNNNPLKEVKIEYPYAIQHPLSDDELFNAVTMIRGQGTKKANNSQTNCTKLTLGLLSYLKTGEVTVVDTEPETFEASPNLLGEPKPVFIKKESGILSRRPIVQLQESYAVHNDKLYNSIPYPWLYYENSNSKHVDIETPVVYLEDEASPRRAIHIDKLNQELLHIAKEGGGVAFGEIGFSRCNDYVYQTHSVAFYAVNIGEKKSVSFIDAQYYNARTQKGNPIFKDLKQEYTFAHQTKRITQNVIGTDVFYLIHSTVNLEPFMAQTSLTNEKKFKTG